ncbi:MAG: helicase DnaB, partial [Trichococcus flocculiformis]
MSYPWQNISPKDAFRASQTNLISDVDRKILTQLYQPIIGPQAFSLYLTLLAEIPQESYWSKELLHTELLALS